MDTMTTKRTERIEETLERFGFTVELDASEETTELEGNVLASGDDEEDTKAEDWVRDQLNGGNEWAWCVAHVRVSHPSAPGIHGDDYMGACSYLSEADFRANEFDDMVRAAFESFAEQVVKASKMRRVIGAVSAVIAAPGVAGR